MNNIKEEFKNNLLSKILLNNDNEKIKTALMTNTRTTVNTNKTTMAHNDYRPKKTKWPIILDNNGQY